MKTGELTKYIAEIIAARWRKRAENMSKEWFGNNSTEKRRTGRKQ